MVGSAAGPTATRFARPSAPRPPRRWDALTLPEQEVMNAAAAHYRRLLWRTPAALAYLRGRRLPDWVLDRCGVGFAPGDTLAAALRPGQRDLARDLGLLART